jgi:uncharacterized protein YggE
MKRVASFSSVTALLLSFLFLTMPLATAQVASTSIPGVSVTGQGRASAPAETATIAIMLGSGEYYKDPAMMEGQEPASPTPPASAQETVQPVIDALVAAGIPAADIEIITDPSSLYSSSYGAPMMVTLRFTIADPTSARIMELLVAATGAATDAGLFVNMTSALYGVADCAMLERGAREDALADARDQAATQAELLDVSIGGVVASRDDVYGAMAYSGMTQINGCSLGTTDGSIASVYNAPGFDPSVEPAVTITMSIELTFEIVPEAAATPGS